MHSAIESFGLSKLYSKARKKSSESAVSTPGILAVNQVDLEVKQGELFGLVGPNGAGKTTLIKMLCTLIIPTDGYARVYGYSLNEDRAIKRSIGLVTTDERSFYWRLTGRQNLEFFATLHEISPEKIIKRINHVLDIVNLQDSADSRFLTYSSGMRQRLSIARALLHKPKLLYLDEPTKGLDLPSIKSMHHLIRKELVNQQNITVFLTSHWLEEVEQLCDRIAIMNNGQIVTCGTMPELRDDLGLCEKYTIKINNMDPIDFQDSSIQNELIHLTPISHNQFSIELRTEASSGDLDKVLDQIKHSNGQITHISHEKISLEEVFSHHLEREDEKNEITSLTIRPEGDLNDRDFTNNVDNRTDDYPPQRFNVGKSNRQKNPFRIPWIFLKRDFRVEISYRFSFFLQFFNVFFSVAIFSPFSYSEDFLRPIINLVSVHP